MEEVVTLAIEPEDIADLETAVGLAGTIRQAEVGGHVCFDLVIAVAHG